MKDFELNLGIDGDNQRLRDIRERKDEIDDELLRLDDRERELGESE